jgi:hypothetical protein
MRLACGWEMQIFQYRSLVMLPTVAPDVPHSVAAGEAGASGKIRGRIEIEIGAPARACTPIEI